VSDLGQRLAAVSERITAACERAGRDPRQVRIVAVSKTQPASAVSEAIAAGVTTIGENRVQEAAAKKPLVAGNAAWHLIGPLQRNKARSALAVFDAVETVDRVELALRLEEVLSTPQGTADAPSCPGPRVVPVFLEVNVGSEPQKAGVPPSECAALASFVARHCNHLHLVGLMAVPPYDPDPERVRPFFATLAALRTRVSEATGLPLSLSMGMSEDFEVAVEEGADWVRLGRVLFGERRPAQ
jgi:hypothetical protein